MHWTLSGGAPDTVRWHTGQSGAPDQGAIRDVFSSIHFNAYFVSTVLALVVVERELGLHLFPN